MTRVPTDREIQTAARILRAGGLVALPTETVYGLGADAENPAAVSRIFQAKRRPASHPLIVHLAAADQLAAGWVDRVPATATRLAERFWPGPLTLVLRRGPRVPAETAGGLPTVAIRVPDHPVALDLLTHFGGGIAAPSANRFGSVSPTTAEHVRADLGNAVDLILDGGPCQVGVESTIVQLVDDQPSILRPGGITAEDLQAALGRPAAVPGISPIRVPGQHPYHYAPRARLNLVEPGEIAGYAESAAEHGLRVGVLAPPPLADRTIDVHTVIPVPRTMAGYASQLYRLLREFDRRGCDLIVASLPETSGLGLAIANRLTRAAGPRTDISGTRPTDDAGRPAPHPAIDRNDQEPGAC
jgi:L-threonylcarbamoyladenylate synthase